MLKMTSMCGKLSETDSSPRDTTDFMNRCANAQCEQTALELEPMTQVGFTMVNRLF